LLSWSKRFYAGLLNGCLQLRYIAAARTGFGNLQRYRARDSQRSHEKNAGTLACSIDAPLCIMSLTCFRWSSPYKKQLRDSARVGAGRHSVANNIVR
jgi:hypothetical protein